MGNLRDESQTFVGIDINLSVIVVHLPCEDIEKRGFSAAISAQDGNTLPFLNLKTQVFQKIFADNKEFCQIFDLNINHCCSPVYE